MALNSLKTKRAAGIAALVTVAAVLSSFQAPRLLADRQKRAHLEGFDGRDLLKLSKVTGPLKVSIQAVTDGEMEAGRPFTLKGVVSANADLQGVSVEWTLPPGIKPVSGPQTDSIAAIAAGETKEFEFTVMPMFGVNRQVYFQAYQAAAGEKTGAIAQYNSTLQPAIEAEAAEKLKETREKIKAGELKKIVQ